MSKRLDNVLSSKHLDAFGFRLDSMRAPTAPTFDDLFRELSSSEGQRLVELIRTRASEPGDGYAHCGEKDFARGGFVVLRQLLD